MSVRCVVGVVLLAGLGSGLAPSSSAGEGKLVRVAFEGVIKTTTGDPFGQSYEHWRDKPVQGYFLYDPATPNALTPEQVEKKRTYRVAGSGAKRTMKEETTHLYLQDLKRPGFTLTLPGHEVVGSRRSLLYVKFHEMDTPNNQFIFKDGRQAYVEYKKREQHGRLMVDGESVKDAEVTLHFFDQGGKLKRAELPERFPFELGEDLKLGAEVVVEGKAILFRITKLAATRIPH